MNQDDEFLQELGLGELPAAEKQKLLDSFYETVEARVGLRLTANMTDAELNEFETLASDQQSDASVLQWLKTKFPDYEQIVIEELNKLKGEIRAANNQPAVGPAAAVKTGDLFKQLGLDKLSDQTKSDLSEELGQVALDRIASRLEALLTPEQADQFEAALQADEVKAFELLRQFVPEYPQIVQQEIAALRDDMTDSQADIMKKMGY